MTLLHALLLGSLQGLTEFLPISSSGHFVIAEWWMGLHLEAASMLGFDVLLHTGTLLALVACYARTWKRMLLSVVRHDPQYRSLLVLLVVATVPAALVGVLFKDLLTSHLLTVPSVALALVATGLLLILGERWVSTRSRDLHGVRFVDALLIGAAQAMALIPGISRSGSTITAARLLGLDRSNALDFSFLMATPAIAGATVLTLVDVARGSVLLPTASVIIVGFATSFITSCIAILWLRRFVKRHALSWFSVYLIPLGFSLLCAPAAMLSLLRF